MPISVDYLVVGGGGSGGAKTVTNGFAGGGGGAGGVVTGTVTTANGLNNYTITVGTGGTSTSTTSNPGLPSSIAGPGITTVTALGGGNGGNGSSSVALSLAGSAGGSGGGGAGDATKGGGAANQPSSASGGFGFAGASGAGGNGGGAGGLGGGSAGLSRNVTGIVSASTFAGTANTTVSNTLVITAVTQGRIWIGTQVTLSNVPVNTFITGFSSGTAGGVGTYIMSAAATSILTGTAVTSNGWHVAAGGGGGLTTGGTMAGGLLGGGAGSGVNGSPGGIGTTYGSGGGGGGQATNAGVAVAGGAGASGAVIVRVPTASFTAFSGFNFSWIDGTNTVGVFTGSGILTIGDTPVVSVAPVISGTIVGNQVANTLTCSTGTWTSPPGTPTYAYQWQRGDTLGTTYTDISGATTSTYITTSADLNRNIRCQVIATNTSGSSSPYFTPAYTKTWNTTLSPSNYLELASDVAAERVALTSTRVTSTIDAIANPFEIIESLQDDTSYIGLQSALRLNDLLGFSVNSPVITSTIDTIANPFQIIESLQDDTSYNGLQSTLAANNLLGFTVNNSTAIQSYVTYGGTDNVPVGGGGGGGSAVNVQTWTLGT